MLGVFPRRRVCAIAMIRGESVVLVVTELIMGAGPGIAGEGCGSRTEPGSSLYDLSSDCEREMTSVVTCERAVTRFVGVNAPGCVDVAASTLNVLSGMVWTAFEIMDLTGLWKAAAEAASPAWTWVGVGPEPRRPFPLAASRPYLAFRTV